VGGRRAGERYRKTIVPLQAGGPRGLHVAVNARLIRTQPLTCPARATGLQAPGRSLFEVAPEQQAREPSFGGTRDRGASREGSAHSSADGARVYQPDTIPPLLNVTAASYSPEAGSRPTVRPLRTGWEQRTRHDISNLPRTDPHRWNTERRRGGSARQGPRKVRLPRMA